MTTLSLIADWYGPFRSVKALKAAVNEWDVGEMLYMVAGRCRYERETILQYTGISRRFATRYHNGAFDNVTRDFQIWYGEISSYSIPGRHSKGQSLQHSVAVTQAEWMLAYFLEISLNVSKRKSPPRRSAILINRWFKTDWETRWKNRKVKGWADFIEYDKEAPIASKVWFGAPPRRERHEAEGIKALKKQDVG
ncbi:MAG: hypothetical protein AB7S41_14250 [Parvibaculaceae bacterium]